MLENAMLYIILSSLTCSSHYRRIHEVLINNKRHQHLEKALEQFLALQKPAIMPSIIYCELEPNEDEESYQKWHKPQVHVLLMLFLKNVANN